MMRAIEVVTGNEEELLREADVIVIDMEDYYTRRFMVIWEKMGEPGFKWLIFDQFEFDSNFYWSLDGDGDISKFQPVIQREIQHP